jgi:3-phenylpropionate/cinnamic acid dioxygenase small subunit
MIWDGEMNTHTTASLVTNDVYLEIQRFHNRESALLDACQYAQWQALLTDDICYRVMARINRNLADGHHDYVFIDEDAVSMKARIDQVSNPKLTHAENPASLTRRFVSGLQASLGDTADQFVATTSILVYRNRPGLAEEGFYVGARRDVLQRIGATLRIARREVQLDHVVLHGAVSTLF